MKKKLKGIVVAAATLALAAVMLAGCSGGGDAQKSDEGKAGDAPFTLTVGFDQGYPPYGYVGDDGQFTGFDLCLLYTSSSTRKATRASSTPSRTSGPRTSPAQLP